MKENTPNPNQLVLLQESLKTTYTEIEHRATQLIRSSEAVANPILASKDPRYSLATIGLLSGPADVFLSHAAHDLQTNEPLARYTPDGFRHMIIREAKFIPDGRGGGKTARLRACDAEKYYHALREESSLSKEPIKFQLYKLLPTIDKEQNSVSVVAAFLPLDTRFMDLRKKVHETFENAHLASTSRLGEVKVLFATLARFPDPPTTSLLDTLDKINATMPQNLEATIENIDVISTTQISYVWVDKHVFLVPPISLTQTNEQPVQPCFVKPSSRLKLP